MNVDDFIARWTAREGGAERANYALFLTEFCDLVGVPRPEPSGAATERNDYVFERAVRPRESEGSTAPKRIDLYKKNSFILEAKQSRLPGEKKAIPGQLALLAEPEILGRRSVARGWDAMMQNARKQAEDYVFRLDADHAAPPFLIVCDVGHCFELFADFTGTGRAYTQFPDRQTFRIFLEDLRDPDIRERFRLVWTDPHALDPTRRAVQVTRSIAARLAAVSKALEARGHDPEEVAHFLMRCIFTMFAEDVDLLPKDAFKALLDDCLKSPDAFAPLLDELWAKMDEPQHERRFYSAFRRHLRHFNGNLFRQARAFPLGREEIGELREAAAHDWTKVDPAIFGTLLEQALDKTQRKKLGAHYTPRAYVQRLVEVTVMEPLRADWAAAQMKAESAKEAGEEKQALAIVKAFHRQLCATRVLDPACGTGNFLYVALELMKKLEGEVLETLAKLGEPESMGLDRETVDPHQFLGLELNPRAAAIAELVVWIGYLQQHYRTRTGHPSEPILRAFANINFGQRHGYDAVLTWDGAPATQVVVRDGKRVETYPNARRPEWPEAEFIVGNPPFIGGKDLRSRLASGYAEALWAAHPHMNESADFVMYWWDRAAELLTRKGTALRRFGLVTTNSISQVFQRRVMERHLNAKAPLSLVYAIPDHPWTKATRDSAAVRIAMTVAEAGTKDGVLLEVVSEEGLETDAPVVSFRLGTGRVNSDLSIGHDVSSARQLKANAGLASRGVVLHGAAFAVTKEEAGLLGLGRRAGLEKHIRPYRNGRDLMARSRNLLVIDLFGLEISTVRLAFPEVYQHLLEHLKPERDTNPRAYRREFWWLFGENVPEARKALKGLTRYIATVETAKHRVFQFLDQEILPDNKLVVITSEDACDLSILESRYHYAWYIANSGKLGVYERDAVYVKSTCFDPFPFPDPPEALRQKLRAAGEELDALRKRVQAEHPDLTLTGLYNVLEKIRAGSPLSEADEDVKRRGLVLVLKDLHDTIDRLTADAYGWPRDLSDEAILQRLVALNAERAREEAAGHVRWLRPDYQIPRFAKGAAPKTGTLDLADNVVAIDRALPAFPADREEQILAVERRLIAAGRPAGAADLARLFKGGGKRIESRIERHLTTLARYGWITALPDGRFAARRAA